ncbi:hypothetical protein SOVF_045260 [Spinacia oleracea]|uniref:Protodermal factor 1 n=1 Tax=Spinacia oleracea TaxID=3562 RepID=A0A9R0ITF2_SPIOL|nr:protodermal factor 1 [Spinacia oleracea]KNA21250.1 hypothetical protein SOVF_045260 [Spinacia oleracea]
MVNSPHSLSQLALFLILCCYFASSSTSAARPGFLFPVHRGRCTPQYWGSSKREEWPKMVPQRSTVSKVFGSRAIERFRSDLTLLEAATRNDDVENAYARVLKQSSAALLNSYSRLGFPYRAWEVKTLLLKGLISEKDAAQQAHILKMANEACN